MQKQATLVHDLSSDEIVSLFNNLQNQIKELKESYEPKQPTELVTRNEAAAIFKCNITTIHNWCKKGKLKPYGIGNRVYFKRTDIEEALTPL